MGTTFTVHIGVEAKVFAVNISPSAARSLLQCGDVFGDDFAFEQGGQ